MLKDDQMATMIVEIRNTFNSPQIGRGNSEIVGRSFEWGTPAMGSVRSLLVRAIPEGDHTRIYARENLGGTNTLFHIWWIISLFLATLFAVIPEIPAIASVIMFAVSALGMAIAWIGSQAISSSRTEELDGLMDRLEHIGQPEAFDHDAIVAPVVQTPSIELASPQEEKTQKMPEKAPRRRPTRRS
jgi:hypothetical protein